MFKRILLISLLIIGMVVLQGNEVSAGYTIGGFGFKTCVPNPAPPPTYLNCSYHANFKIVGGSNLKFATFLKGKYWVAYGWLAGVNPQDKDVRVGIAGLAWTELTNPDTDFLIDQNGKQYLDQVLWNYVWEFDPNAYLPDSPEQAAASARCIKWTLPNPPDDDCDPLVAWANFWGLVDENDWRDLLNKQWTPQEILVTVIDATGTFLTDCAVPNDPTTCITSYGEGKWTCATDEDIRYWPGDDNEVNYVCNTFGYPIAFDDIYTTTAGKTLKVSAPGVLGNDYNRNGTQLQVKSVDTTVTLGTVTWKPDGSFSYTPPKGLRISSDTFNYVANNGTGDSNVATVTITVK